MTGDSISFKVTVNSGYKISSVTLNGATLNAENDVYTFDATSNNVIKVEIVSENVVVAEDATLSFSNVNNRTKFTNDTQVWEENGVKLTNNKAASTNAIANYSNPARFYANSELIVEMANMTKITFVCNSSSYATALKNAIADSSDYTVTVSGSNVIVEFVNPIDSFTVAKLGGQVRMNSLTVSYLPE